MQIGSFSTAFNGTHYTHTVHSKSYLLLFPQGTAQMSPSPDLSSFIPLHIWTSCPSQSHRIVCPPPIALSHHFSFFSASLMLQLLLELGICLLCSWSHWKLLAHLSSRQRILSLFFSHPVLSNSLQPQGLQHARPPCPSPSPEVCPS